MAETELVETGKEAVVEEPTTPSADLELVEETSAYEVMLVQSAAY